MPTRAGGWQAGRSRAPVALRDALEDDGALPLDGAAWQGLDDPAARPAGPLSIPSDDVLVAVADDDPGIPVHATWHRIHVESGPYTVEGELATLPGFDPGRALTRPSGEFLYTPRRPAVGARPTRGRRRRSATTR